MAANIIHVSDELLAQLREKAQADGKTVDQLAEEALRKKSKRPEVAGIDRIW